MSESTGVSADSLLEGPMACAFFLAAKRYPIGAEHLCNSRIAFSVAAEARFVLDPWAGDHPRAVAQALAQRDEVRTLAEEVLSLPGSRWWSRPLDRKVQVHVAGPRPPERVGQHPPQKTESLPFAQSPKVAVISSTNVQGDSCWETFADRHLGDEEPVSGPHRTLLAVSASARVYEIHSASDWLRLVQNFPLSGSETARGGVSPDWSRVAEVWDGVHLSFAGLLRATYAGFEAGASRSVLWTWEREQTRWFGDVVSAGEQIDAPPRAARVTFTHPLLADLRPGGNNLQHQR